MVQKHVDVITTVVEVYTVTGNDTTNVWNINSKDKKLSYLQRNSASTKHVFLGSLINRAIHWTQQMLHE